MKNKIWVLILIAGMVLMISACEQEDNNKHTPSNHLGIGEICSEGGTKCGLQDYNTSTEPNKFPKPIYRIGELFDGLNDAAERIIKAYRDTIMDTDDREGLKKDLEAVHIDQSAPIKTSGKILTIPVSAVDVAIANELALIAHPTSDHLGIAESCLGSGRVAPNKCGLQNHANATQMAALNNKPVYRYGKSKHYSQAELTSGINNIILLYNATKVRFDTEDGGNYQYEGFANEVMDNITLCIAKASKDGFAWIADKKVLGIDPTATQADIIWVTARMNRHHPNYTGTAFPKNDVADGLLVQLQPAGNIRLAGGQKKKTEQFPVVAARRKWVSVTWIA